MRTERRRGRSRTGIEVLVSLGLLLLAGSASAQAQETYTVQPGDTCLGIVKKLGGRISLEELHALNPDVYHGPPPHHLEPGTVLRLTRGPVVPDAHLTFVKPLVETRKPDSPFWYPGSVGLDLYRRYRVATESGATTEVTFRDDSEVQLLEESLLVIYGATASRSKRKPRVALEEGALRGGLAELRGESALDVKTPAAKVSARSRDVQVEVDPARTTRLSVYDGEADIAARGVTVRVPKGKGTVARMGKPPEPPAPLPPAPQWPETSGLTTLLIDEPSGNIRLNWNPVPQARTYEVQVARDERFRDLVARQKVTAPEHAVAVDGLEPGLYRARVAARDGRGLLGEASSPRALAVVAVVAKGCRRVGDHLEADGYATLSFGYRGVPLVVSVDGTVVHPGRVSLVGPGTREVTVQVREEGFAPMALPVVVRDFGLAAKVSPERLPAEGGRATVTVSATSQAGEPVPLQPEWLRMAPPPTDLLLDDDGNLVATLEVGATETPRSLPIRIYLGSEPSPRVTLSASQEGPGPLPGRPAVAAGIGPALLLSSGNLGWNARLEVGYLPPAVTQHLLLGLEAGMAGTSQGDDGRNSLEFGLNGTWRTRPAHGLTGYLGAGYVMHLNPAAKDSGGSRSTFGLEAILGTGYALGPGEATLEVRVHYQPAGQTGASSGLALGGSALGLTLGYRWLGSASGE